MILLFSDKPGAHERHLKRKYRNPLFPAPAREITEEDVRHARSLDQQELDQFMTEFQALVKEIAELEGHVEGEVMHGLKERLDRSFDACASLAGNLEEVRQHIVRLVGVIMNAIQADAAQDPKALATLQEEDEARSLHYSLLETPLVADLLRPESPIAPNELAATLLSEDEASLGTALLLFSPQQQQALYDEARSLLERLEAEGEGTGPARQRLALIEATLAQRPH